MVGDLHLKGGNASIAENRSTASGHEGEGSVSWIGGDGKNPSCHGLGVEVGQAIFFGPVHCLQEFLGCDPAGDLRIFVRLCIPHGIEP